MEFYEVNGNFIIDNQKWVVIKESFQQMKEYTQSISNNRSIPLLFEFPDTGGITTLNNEECFIIALSEKQKEELTSLAA